jgi:hypothetical protein
MITEGHNREFPQARRRWWIDSRFIIGLVLVVGSIGGVLAVITAADSSIQVLVARTTLLPGDTITNADVVVTSVRLDAASAQYLSASDLPEGGLVVGRTVATGELVPVKAVGLMSGTSFSAVVLVPRGALSASVASGSLVDVWASRETEAGQFGAPVVLIPSALVVRIIQSEAIVAGNSAGSVEVLVPRTAIARLLEAIANEDALSLVPAHLPVGE